MARRDATSSSSPSTQSPNRQPEADELVDEAIEVGHGRYDPLVVHARLRLELLKVKISKASSRTSP
jgi:hypothetical protein